MKYSACLRVCAVLALTALVAPAALAADDGWHVLGALTGTSQNLKDERFQGATDECDMGWALGLGYFFMPILAVQVTFEDLGETDFDGTFDYMDTGTNGTNGTGAGVGVGVSDVGTIEVEAIVLSLLYQTPMSEHWSFQARAGAAFYDVEENEVFGGTPERNTDSGEAPLVGVGVGWKLSDAWGLRAELRRYFDVGERDKTGEGDIDTARIGAVLRF